jgi:integrase
MIIRRGKGFGVRVYDSGSPGRQRWVGTFRTKAEARDAERAAEIQRREGLRPLTVEEVSACWLRDSEPRWEVSTHAHNRERIKRVIAAFGPRRLDSLTHSEVMAWAPGHRGAVAVARAMANHGIRLGATRSNPFANLGLKQSRGRRDIAPLTPEEVHALADAGRGFHGSYGEVFSAMILFLAYVGCRPGEMFAVEWADLDLSNLEVKISKQRRKDGLALPKNKLARTVILPPPARDALLRMPRTLHSDLVFTSKTGRPLTSGTFRYVWVPVAAAQGWADRDPYELRHFCGSYLADRGISAQDIALQLGHTDGGRLAQKLYIHTYDDHARERLKRVFEGNVTPLRPVEGHSDGVQVGSGGA